MTAAEAVETSVTTTCDSLAQDYTNLETITSREHLETLKLVFDLLRKMNFIFLKKW